MVHVAGNLPKGEANGLEAYSRTLAEALVSAKKFFVVGVVETASVKTKRDDLMPDPTVGFTRVELIEFESELEAPAAGLLEAAADARRGGAGQQKFDFDKPGDADPEEPRTLEVESGPGYYFQVRDLPAGRFGLYLCTRYVEGIAKRGNLLRSELGEVAPGDYQEYELPAALQELGRVLIEEWETDTGASTVDEDVVDADVVDEIEGEE